MHHFQSLPEKAVVVYSFEHICSADSTYNICTMLRQRRRRWAVVVQILYKCFVFARMGITCLSKMIFCHDQAHGKTTCTNFVQNLTQPFITSTQTD